MLKLSPYGAFVELDKDIHGLAHVSELSGKTGKTPAQLLKAGETKEFKIISLEPGAHRLGLALADSETTALAEEPAAPSAGEEAVEAVKE